MRIELEMQCDECNGYGRVIDEDDSFEYILCPKCKGLKIILLQKKGKKS